jgi:hypothetical protein
MAVDDGDLDEMEAIGILGLILSAGGESTTSQLGTGVRCGASSSCRSPWSADEHRPRALGLTPT